MSKSEVNKTSDCIVESNNKPSTEKIQSNCDGTKRKPSVKYLSIAQNDSKQTQRK